MRSSTVKGWAAERLVHMSGVGGCGLGFGTPIYRGLRYRGLGGLPRDSGVNVVAGCSGTGGEKVEAVLERGGGRADVERRALVWRGYPQWVMRACAERMIRYGAGV